MAQLAKASGLARRSIEAIEAGGVTKPAERHHITVALGWLSANQVTKALPVTAPRGDAALAPGAAVDQTPPRRKLKVPGSAGQWAGRVVAHGVVQ